MLLRVMVAFKGIVVSYTILALSGSSLNSIIFYLTSFAYVGSILLRILYIGTIL
jgi:hypothetical protein